MSNVEELEAEIRGLQEMLFLVLDKIGEPVVVNTNQIDTGYNGKTRGIEAVPTTNGDWTLSVCEVEDE